VNANINSVSSIAAQPAASAGVSQFFALAVEMYTGTKSVCIMI
jgi:hypothetical protein